MQGYTKIIGNLKQHHTSLHYLKPGLAVHLVLTVQLKQLFLTSVTSDLGEIMPASKSHH